MAINVTIGDKVVPAVEQEAPKPPQATIELQMRKTLEGDIVVFDHRDIDIVLMPRKNKVIAFGKENYGEQVYATINRLFNFLSRKGVIELGSERGGNIYSSVEAVIPASDKHNTAQLVLFTIAKWIEEERPYLDWEEKLEDEWEDSLTAPSSDESTEFDPSRHKETKGSVNPHLRPYGMYTSYEYE